MVLIACALIAFSIFSTVHMQNSPECINPRKLRGQCIALQQCSYLLTVARFAQQNQDALFFLQQSQCGYNQYATFVCCPQSSQGNVLPNQNQQVNRNLVIQKLLPKPPVCGSGLDDRIIGGTRTSINEFPWVTLLKYSRPSQSNPTFGCSGSLINDRYTITAAHCVHSKTLQRTKLVGVRLGEWNLSTNPDCDDSFINEVVCNNPHVDIGIENVIIHEKFLPQSFNQHNDIALIRMNQRIVFNDFIKPICLPSSIDNLVGNAVTLTGFGRTETASSSNLKLKVVLNVVENDRCNQIFRVEGRRLNVSQICAGGLKNFDTCRGDSGGPMMKLETKNRLAFWTLVGIVSFGSNPCGQENKPAVYTRVGSFINWIESNIKI